MLAPHRESAIQTARAFYRSQPVYMDTETTGLDENAEIVEICILDSDGSILVYTLVKPRQPIPAQAIAIHGITNGMVALAPTWPEIWPQVEDALRDRTVGIYNADFDVRMLQQTQRKYGLRWPHPLAKFFCIMKLYARFYGEPNSFYGSYRWQKLEAAARQCGLLLSNSHRAQDDTLLAQALLEYMAGERG